MSARILIVDDDRAFRIATTALLEDSGHVVESVANARAAQERVQAARFDLVLTDLVMEGTNGMQLLGWLRDHAPAVTVIMITGFASVHTAVEAMRLGAFDYITKPSGNDELLVKVSRALAVHGERRELEALREERRNAWSLGGIVSQNERMRGVFRLLQQVAETDVTVLLLGETGTGKELAARAIHAGSLRRNGPFVAVTCAALPETLLESELFGHEKDAFTGASRQRIGRFEESAGGTIFLDEIGDVPLPMQTKLLRVLQEREVQRLGGGDPVHVDVRVVAATNADLAAAVAEGRFRADLYYRLNEFPVTLPPLRERLDDLPLLVRHFIGKHAALAGGRVTGAAPAAMAELARRTWPGNVRELESAVKRALIVCGGPLISTFDLHQDGIAPASAVVDTALPYRDFIGRITAEAEERYLRDLLARHAGNVSAAADAAEIDRKTLYRRLEERAIDPAAFRDGEAPDM